MSVRRSLCKRHITTELTREPLRTPAINPRPLPPMRAHWSRAPESGRAGCGSMPNALQMDSGGPVCPAPVSHSRRGFRSRSRRGIDPSPRTAAAVRQHYGSRRPRLFWRARGRPAGPRSPPAADRRGGRSGSRRRPPSRRWPDRRQPTHTHACSHRPQCRRARPPLGSRRPADNPASGTLRALPPEPVAVAGRPAGPAPVPRLAAPRVTARHVLHTLALLPLVKSQVFCVGDR